MFDLIGSRKELVDTFTSVDVEEIVATFDSMEDAYGYIEKATLKNAKSWHRRPFKKKSLLQNYERASVESSEIKPPHNPEWS